MNNVYGLWGAGLNLCVWDFQVTQCQDTALAARLVCKTSWGKTEQPCRDGKCRVNRGQAWVEECQGPEVIFTKDRCKSDKKTRSQSSPQLRTSSTTKDMCTLMWPRPDHRAFGQCLHRVSAFPRARNPRVEGLREHAAEGAERVSLLGDARDSRWTPDHGRFNFSLFLCRQITLDVTL